MVIVNTTHYMFIIYTYIYFKAVPPGEELWHTPFLCHNGTSIDKPPTFQEKIHTQPHKTPVIMFVLGVYMYHTVRIQEYFLHIYVEWYKPYKMYGSIALKQLEMSNCERNEPCKHSVLPLKTVQMVSYET